MDNELILYDRIEMIKTVIRKYGEDKCYISFSGGKDSTALSYLIDLALPNNKIPRVYANTGIEYNLIKDFVLDLMSHDDRYIMIKPKVPIKKMLERDGYPFKSKHHSEMWDLWNRDHDSKSAIKYRDGLYNFASMTKFYLPYNSYVNTWVKNSSNYLIRFIDSDVMYNIKYLLENKYKGDTK